MKQIVPGFLLAILFTLAVSTASRAEDERLKRLSPEHRKWLEEEVVYIMLDKEREVFLALETVEERNYFIEAFWRKRDPNRATPENEFKEEHYRRIEYANEFLGRETSLPGWRTDRGRMHIILGEPREIQRFTGYNELVNSQLWFYEGDPRKALPAFFYILFFQRDDVGEFRLYSPVMDGPNSLLHGMEGEGGVRREAVRVLRGVSRELAQASLSLDPSEPADFENFRPALSSGILLARIDDSPKRAIRADYADAWRDYGDRVSAEYSFNFVPSRSYFAVLNGPDETPFVNYSIEIDAQNFSMETDEANTRFYTALDISVEARNEEGVVVLARDREDYLELEPGQFQDARASPFSYQADFPLLPGQYKVSVILRNRVLKQYTVAESDITVEPLWSGKPTLSDLILGYSVDELLGTSARENEFWTFQVGSARVHPAAGGVFSLGETVHVFLQVQGAPPDSQVHIALLNGEEVLQERTTTLSKYLGGPVIERFPLRGMVGGRYVFRVRLLDPSGAVAAERTAGCQISPRAAIPRPWVTRVSFNAATPGLLALARGDQFLAEKRLPEATAEFEKALAAGGAELPVARWRLALILIQTGDAARALELLTPIEQQFPNQVEVVAGLGYAYSLRDDCSKALGYLERAITLRPPDTTLLNVLANCYERTGDNLKATEAYERSLALNPEQQRVKEHLASIQGNNP